MQNSPPAVCQQLTCQLPNSSQSGNALCTSCSIRQELDEAERDYKHHCNRIKDLRKKEYHDTRDDEYLDARRRYDQARVAYRRYQDVQAEHDDGEHQPTSCRTGIHSAAHHDADTSASAGSARVPVRRARFDERQLHRRERKYRRPMAYKRKDRAYKPGRFANRFGQGWLNTSDPNAGRGDSGAEDEDEDEVEDGDGDEDGDLSHLSDDELSTRIASLRGQLAKLG